MDLRSLSILVFATHVIHGVFSATSTITNNCPYTIWPGILSGTGSASTTGIELASKASSSVNVPAPWSGRVWACFQCSNTGGKLTCHSGDCGTGQVECNNKGAAPPPTLVEFTIAANGGQDFYDVSNVDGFNLPVSVVPQGGSGCNSTACPVDINAQYLPDLAVKDPAGGTIGCKSACIAFNQPQYCCSGAQNTPETCPPTNYSMFFKKLCPQAYSYAYDDKTSTFTCSGGANYLITFCP